METTGLNPPRDKIVELAIVDQSDSILINTLINPARTIPEQVIGIHGIEDDMVRNAPLMDEKLGEIRKIFQSVERIVIYNAQFDIRFFPEDIWGKAEILCCMQAQKQGETESTE